MPFYLSALSLSCRARLLTTARSKVAVSNRRSTFRTPLSNIEREGEEDSDARRRNRDRVVVVIGPVHTPAAIPLPATIVVPTAIIVAATIVVPTAIIVAAAIIVPAALLWPLAPMVIFAERRPRGYTADHRGEEERHHDPTDD